MAQRHLDFGTSAANDGETIHSAFQKIEDNTADLYARVGGVEDDVADLYSRVGGVSTVNGEEGAVVLDATEIDIDSLVPANYTPSDPSIEGHLEGIDDALSFAGGGDMLSTNNLSDVSNASTARANLGLTIGTDVQAYDADLAALAGLTTTGIVVRSGSGTASTCGLAAGAGISVTNNDGVSGSPSIAVDVSGLSDRPSFTSGAKIPVSIGGTLYKFDYDDLPGAGGGISAAFANVTDGSATAAASGSGTFKLRVGTGLTVAVTNNDATHGDNALFSLDDELVALAGLTSAADSAPYFTGSGTAALMTVTTAARSILDDASTGAIRTTLGVGTSDTPQFTGIEVGNASDTTLTRSAAGILAVEGVVIKNTGKETIWVPATAMIARATNGAASGSVEATTNKNMFKTLDFDTSTQEFAQFEIHMPKAWNLSTITFQPVWSHASTTTNFGVVWALQAVARSDDDAGDVAFGTEQTSTDTGGTTNDIYIGPESSAITVGGSPATGDTVLFQIKRAPADASDTMAIDARLHGVRVFFTTNAATDA